MIRTKEFKTFDEQIELLESRKLKFQNKKKAKEFLNKFNYFDVINGFESLFVSKNEDGKEYRNIYFEDFCSCFLFDLKLKSSTLDEILTIEERLKTSIAYHFAELYCRNEADTLNYTIQSYYHAPSSSDTHLVNTFNGFDLFRQTQFYPDGSVKRRSFIDDIKNQKAYIASYELPPFWVTIKTLPFGSLYYLFVFLPNDVKSKVLEDFGFAPNEIDAFTEAISILKEARNECAHLELITRFKLKADPKQNYFNNIKNKLELSRRELYFIDVLKIISCFGSSHTIRKNIFRFYIKQFLDGRLRIALKILSKMGRKRLLVWMKIK